MQWSKLSKKVTGSKFSLLMLSLLSSGKIQHLSAPRNQKYLMDWRTNFDNANRDNTYTPPTNYEVRG